MIARFGRTICLSALLLSVGAIVYAPAFAEIADYGYGAAPAGGQRPALDLRAEGPRAPAQLQRALALRSAGQAGQSQVQGGAHSSPAAAEFVGSSLRPAWLETEQLEAPYQAEGVWFVPTAEPDYTETGLASWYGAELAGRRTASGEAFDPNGLTAAHPTLPLQSLVQVTNLATGAEVILRINDRGPFKGGRIIDVSRKAAEVLGIERAGQGRVHVRYLGPAPRRVDELGRLAPRAQSQPSAAPAATPERRPAAPPPPHRFAQAEALFVQIGAFSSPANAARAQAQAAAAGPGRIDVTRRGDQTLHLVRVGPWPNRAQAETARARAAAAGLRGAVIVEAAAP